jgi:HAD superfamily hydrolase (TIGR01490 family)
MQPVAFFDIDGTVFRSSLLVSLVEALIDADVFQSSMREQYAIAHANWLNREGTYEAYISALIDAFLRNLQGVHYGEFADVGRRVVAEQGRHVYRYTRDLILDLRRDGYYIVAISQSPKTILDEFCDAYGFDKVYGRMYEIGPQDRFTGSVIDEYLIMNKASIVQRVCAHQKVDSAHAIAVGDTDADIPLLEAVAHPICFNPNQRLYDHAKRRQWSVVVERKDVIYTL